MIPSPNRIALSFLAVGPQELQYRIYRRELSATETSLPNTYLLPKDCAAEEEANAKRLRYELAFEGRSGFEESTLRAWANPSLTVNVLHHALARRASEDDLKEQTEVQGEAFTREVAFVLRRYGDVREVMWLRAYDLRAVGRFGFLCSFALRVPRDSPLPPKRRLELSLTHKAGRLNTDYYLDQYGKLETFLEMYFQQVKDLWLHDGTPIRIERKLSAIPAFTLRSRKYVFANNRENNSQFFGLRDGGPFHTADPGTQIVFLFQPMDRSKSQELFRALRGDTYSTFPGMSSMFGVPFGRQNVSGIEVSSFKPDDLRSACTYLTTEFPKGRVVPVALVPMTKHVSEEESQAYYAAKHTFLGYGLSSQFVDRKRLEDRSALKWSISNIGLAIFAKMGGVPWRVRASTDKCLIVGVGQAHRISEGRVVKYLAYSVLTDSSGVYETIKVLSQSADRAEYLRDLKTNLKQVLVSHADNYRSFVLHVTFTMRAEELESIRSLLDDLKTSEGPGREFIALKFNDHNAFFGFATEHNSRVPDEGTVARLSKREFLIWFSGVGVADSKTPAKPERPAHVRVLYPDTPLTEADLSRLFQDAMNIAGANWRGFNAKSMPISIYYSRLIADYYSHFRDAGLAEVSLDGLPPWFL